MRKIYNYNEYIKENGFWGTVGAGILPICTETKRVLLPLRSDEVMEPNTWGIWGGKLDDMETNDTTVACKIEFEEESGYSGNIKLIPSFVFKNKNKRGEVDFIYHNYIGLLDEEFDPILNWETEDYMWCTFDEMMSIEPKHFGLTALLENDIENIKKYL